MVWLGLPPPWFRLWLFWANRRFLELEQFGFSMLLDAVKFCRRESVREVVNHSGNLVVWDFGNVCGWHGERQAQFQRVFQFRLAAGQERILALGLQPFQQAECRRIKRAVSLLGWRVEDGESFGVCFHCLI